MTEAARKLTTAIAVAMTMLLAAVAEHLRTAGADIFADQLPAPGHELPDVEPTTAEVRAWARARGLDVPERGRLRPETWTAYRRAHTTEAAPHPHSAPELP